MAASKAVTEGLAAVVQEVQQVGEGSFRLLISAGKVDKRKSFYKQFQKIRKSGSARWLGSFQIRLGDRG